MGSIFLKIDRGFDANNKSQKVIMMHLVTEAKKQEIREIEGGDGKELRMDASKCFAKTLFTVGLTCLEIYRIS